MASIDNLDDWILEEIFQMLPHFDRLLCKEVCKRWNNILMERKIFQKDQRIQISTCSMNVREPPMNVFMQAKKPYQVYTLHDHISGVNKDVIRFFQHVGPNIEKLRYFGYPGSDIFTTMPSLKHLTWITELENIEGYFTKIKVKNANSIFRRLESLKIYDSSIFDLEVAIKSIKNIKKFIPESCLIILHEIFIRTHKDFEIMEMAKINNITIHTNRFSQTEIEQLLDVGNIHCDKFTLNCASEHRPYRIIEALQNKHPNLKEFKIDCHFLPPNGINFPKVTSLNLEVSAPFLSLKSLEHLTNLKELVLKIDKDECGFGHETLMMPKLVRLETYIDDLCEDCFEALTNSFVNLTDITLRTFSNFGWSALNVFIGNWKKLLKINYQSYEIDEVDEEGFSFESENHLCTLKIATFTNLKIETINKISDSFQNLEELELFSNNLLAETPLLNIVQAVIPALTKLTEFRFNYNELDALNKVKIEEYERICDYLDVIGLPMENRDRAIFTFKKRNFVELTFDREQMTSEMIAIDYD